MTEGFGWKTNSFWKNDEGLASLQELKENNSHFGGPLSTARSMCDPRKHPV